MDKEDTVKITPKMTIAGVDFLTNEFDPCEPYINIAKGLYEAMELARRDGLVSDFEDDE